MTDYTALAAKFTHITVGRDRQQEGVAAVRTARQRQTVFDITQDPEFDYAVSNPFTVEVGDHKGTFNFLYYKRGDSRLHGVRISGAGRIISQTTAG